MNAQQLERHRHALLGIRPARPAERLAAIRALVRDASPAALRLLLDTVVGGDDPHARTEALDALRRLADWRCIGDVCAAWAATRSPELALVLRERGWVASYPHTLRVLTALCAGRPDLLADGRPSMVLPLVQACQDRDAEIAAAARATLIRLSRRDAQEALCRLAVHHDNPIAREMALVAGFLPADPRDRALFLFMTSQWDAYRAADSDGALLSAAYSAADVALGGRIIAQAQRARMTDWARRAVSSRRRIRPADMSSAEWEAVLRAIGCVAHEDTWALAQHAPALYAAPLLRRLTTAGWAPADATERARFEDVARLAGACQVLPPTAPSFAGAWLGHQRSVGHVTFSPDATLLASGGADGAVHLWDVGAEPPAPRTLRHAWAIDGISFSLEGRHLLSASTVGALRLWRVRGYAVIGADGAADTVAFDGRHPALFIPGAGFASSTTEGAIHIRRLPDGATTSQFSAHQGKIGALAASPDGRLLASAGAGGPAVLDGRFTHPADNSLRLWRLPEGRPAGLLDPGGSRVEQLLFGPSGRLLAAGERLRLWNVPDGMLIAELDGRAPVAFADGESIAAAGADGSVWLWRRPGAEPPVALENQDRSPFRSVTCLAVSPDGRMLAAGSADGTLRLWLLPEGRLLGAMNGFEGPVTCVAISADRRTLVAGGADGTLRQWRIGAAPMCMIAAGRLTLVDVALTRDLLQNQGTTDEELPWLALVVALGMQLRRRGDRTAQSRTIAAGAFDIEVPA